MTEANQCSLSSDRPLPSSGWAGQSHCLRNSAVWSQRLSLAASDLNARESKSEAEVARDEQEEERHSRGSHSVPVPGPSQTGRF